MESARLDRIVRPEHVGVRWRASLDLVSGRVSIPEIRRTAIEAAEAARLAASRLGYSVCGAIYEHGSIVLRLRSRFDPLPAGLGDD